jgi:tetratricopeptide (TPR) repeat protein
MLKIVEQTIDARTSRFTDSNEKPRGPLFTFLIGAGFSVTAGVSSVQHLVLSLEKFKKNRSLNWFDIFDQTKEESFKELNVQYDQITDHYFSLIEEVLPLPQSRHDFITAAIQWASARKVQINIESILLATLLIAGTGGTYPKGRNAEKRGWLARSFAKHVFTTNFDEVMPTTFYLGNSPVEIIDRDSSVNLLAEYPTLVYLHGRHLHFKMRNTKHELQREKEENDRDLFEQFRDVLRNTGLIVIGYAGATDKVSQMIQDAIEDPESLPYGLWWCSYKEEEQSIHPELLSAIYDNDRSFILEKGKDAEQVMRLIAKEVGIDAGGAIGVWKDRLTVMNQEVNRFIDRSAFDFNAFNMTVAQALLFLDESSLNGAHKEWQELKDFLYEHEDKTLVVDILSKVSRLLIEVGNKNDLEQVFEEGIDLCRKSEKATKLAYFLIDQGEYYKLIGEYKKCSQVLNEAIEILSKEHNKVGLTKAYKILIESELINGQFNVAEKNLEKLRLTTEGLTNELGTGDYFYLVGLNEYLNNEPDKGADCFVKAIEKHNVAGDQRDLIKDRRALAYCYIKLKSDVIGAEIAEINKIQLLLENKREQIQNRLLNFTLDKENKSLDSAGVKFALEENSVYFDFDIESRLKRLITKK